MEKYSPLFETKLTTPRTGKKRPLKSLGELRKIARDIVNELAGQNYEFRRDEDWESMADKIMADNYDLSEQEEQEVADLLPAAIKRQKRVEDCRIQ